jgi:hypothetical protein
MTGPVAYRTLVAVRCREARLHGQDIEVRLLVQQGEGELEAGVRVSEILNQGRGRLIRWRVVGAKVVRHTCVDLDGETA